MSHRQPDRPAPRPAHLPSPDGQASITPDKTPQRPPAPTNLVPFNLVPLTPTPPPADKK